MARKSEVLPPTTHTEQSYMAHVCIIYAHIWQMCVMVLSRLDYGNATLAGMHNVIPTQNGSSRWWIPGWCSRRPGRITSLRSFFSFLGWKLKNEFSISWPFYAYSHDTDVSTEWHQRIWSMNISNLKGLWMRTRLRSALTISLPVRRTWLSTVGDRAFPVAAARTWNDRPRHVTSASPVCFPKPSELKMYLFRRSFP